MKCPRCKRLLTPREAGGIVVDVCEGGCGGLWFDQCELQRVDNGCEPAGEALLHIPVDPDVTVDLEERVYCPKCPESIVMMRFFYSPRREVQVDHCPNCGGHWLDANELEAVRKLYASTDDRHRHFELVVAESFGAEVTAMAQHRQRHKTRLVVTGMFGFLRG